MFPPLKALELIKRHVTTSEVSDRGVCLCVFKVAYGVYDAQLIPDSLVPQRTWLL